MEDDKKTILIVDDQELSCTLLSVILNEGRQRYHIITAENGAEACEIVVREEGRFDLILLDIGMPIMGGFEFLEEMRRLSIDIPTVIITGEASEENIAKALRMGVKDVIAKPYDPYMARNRVDRLSGFSMTSELGETGNNGVKTVLIVDDSMFNQKILGHSLEEDYRILTADNGRDAIHMVNGRIDEFSVILLDAAMPVMDGVETMRYWSAIGLPESVPIIAITSKYDADRMQQMIDLGARDVINPPFYPEVVRNRVNNIVELAEKIAQE